jgi:23S rRNA (guanosine2251-2'-O)-methyltransferase
MTGPLALVVGSEGEGLRRLVRDRCDWMMSIPMRGQINSLNAAVAGSIALYEALRQRRHI